jgi:nifR3 family TIM-barrel protein
MKILGLIMIQLGSAHMTTNIFLAPLSGCSDLAFRLIARECGAKFCFFEMVDAHALVRPHPKRFDILRSSEQDRPIAGQLVGEKPELLRDAAQILVEHVPITFLDVNSACPVKKVVKKGAGAALLQEPQKLAQILSLLASNLSIPITVKLRIGYHQVNMSALLDLVKLCEASGVSAIFLHGRTRDQLYSGDVNYEAIRAVKAAVSIPVFGSGNILTPELAKQMFEATGCDGILVARGAFGNPWIFREIEHYLQHGTLAPEISLEERKAVLKRQLAYLREFRMCSLAGKIGFMRKVTLWYLKGFPNASRLRGLINTIPDYETLIRFIDEHMPQ